MEEKSSGIHFESVPDIMSGCCYQQAELRSLPRWIVESGHVSAASRVQPTVHQVRV
jgi:hypothetical protein